MNPDQWMQPHPCEHPECTVTVAFDDEPYCFHHSPDEGSSLRGYSYIAKHGGKAKSLNPDDEVWEYYIWLNRDAMFMRSYKPGDHMDVSYRGKITHKSFNSDVHSILTHLFRVFNVDQPDDYHYRSLSVGDVVILNGLAYACEMTGWSQLADATIS